MTSNRFLGNWLVKVWKQQTLCGWNLLAGVCGESYITAANYSYGDCPSAADSAARRILGETNMK